MIGCLGSMIWNWDECGVKWEGEYILVVEEVELLIEWKQKTWGEKEWFSHIPAAFVFFERESVGVRINNHSCCAFTVSVPIPVYHVIQKFRWFFFEEMEIRRMPFGPYLLNPYVCKIICLFFFFINPLMQLGSERGSPNHEKESPTLGKRSKTYGKSSRPTNRSLGSGVQCGVINQLSNPLFSICKYCIYTRRCRCQLCAQSKSGIRLIEVDLRISNLGGDMRPDYM